MYIVSEIKIRSIIQDRVDIFYIFNDVKHIKMWVGY